MAQDAREASGYESVLFGVPLLQELVEHGSPEHLSNHFIGSVLAKLRDDLAVRLPDNPLGSNKADVLAAGVTVRLIARERLGEPHDIGFVLAPLFHRLRSRHPKAPRHRSHILVPRDDDAVVLVAVGHPEAHEIVRFEPLKECRSVRVHEMLAELLKAERLALVSAMRLVRLVNVHAERPRLIAHGDPEALRIVPLHPLSKEDIDARLSGV